MALVHVVWNRVEPAYARSDLFAQFAEMVKLERDVSQIARLIEL